MKGFGILLLPVGFEGAVGAINKGYSIVVVLIFFLIFMVGLASFIEVLIEKKLNK